MDCADPNEIPESQAFWFWQKIDINSLGTFWGPLGPSQCKFFSLWVGFTQNSSRTAMSNPQGFGFFVPTEFAPRIFRTQNEDSSDDPVIHECLSVFLQTKWPTNRPISIYLKGFDHCSSRSIDDYRVRAQIPFLSWLNDVGGWVTCSGSVTEFSSETPFLQIVWMVLNNQKFGILEVQICWGT